MQCLMVHVMPSVVGPLLFHGALKKNCAKPRSHAGTRALGHSPQDECSAAALTFRPTTGTLTTLRYFEPLSVYSRPLHSQEACSLPSPAANCAEKANGSSPPPAAADRRNSLSVPSVAFTSEVHVSVLAFQDLPPIPLQVLPPSRRIIAYTSVPTPIQSTTPVQNNGV